MPIVQTVLLFPLQSSLFPTVTRLRHESLVHIVDGIKFQDGNGIDVKDFESSASRFNAFAKKIGYQEATGDAAAFYSPLKAEILFEEYDGTMNTTKIFRGPLLLKVIFSSSSLALLR
jgi:hypothetical protein